LDAKAETMLNETIFEKITCLSDLLQNRFSTAGEAESFRDSDILDLRLKRRKLDDDGKGQGSAAGKPKDGPPQPQPHPRFGPRWWDVETPLPCNERIVALIDATKPEVHALQKIISTLRSWVQLSIPKIEDGDNFGVEVQEEVLKELMLDEQSNTYIMESIPKYCE
jgi:hypothetical protein